MFLQQLHVHNLKSYYLKLTQFLLLSWQKFQTLINAVYCFYSKFVVKSKSKNETAHTTDFSFFDKPISIHVRSPREITLMN